MNLLPVLQFSRSASPSSFVGAVVCAALVMFITSSPTRGQSGRHAASRESEKPSTPALMSAPVATSPRFKLVVGGLKHDPSMNYPLDFEALVVSPCVARLQASSEVSVAEAGKMTRQQARERAKASADEHVVWLGLGVEASVAGSPADANDERLGLRRVFVDYYVFAPRTAKVVTHGRVFQAAGRVGVGKVGVGLPLPAGGINPRRVLEEAGRESGDEVLRALGVEVRPRFS